MNNPSPTVTRKTHQRRSQAERSQETQRKIIDSALKLLKEVGFHQTNMQDIARGAKVTLGAVQHQFGSREVLMERVVDEVMAPFADLGSVWPPVVEPLTFEERASRFVRSAWEKVYAPPSYLAAWSLFLGCKSDSPLFSRIDEHRAKHDPMFFAHFVEAFPEIARNHPQPEHFAAVIFAALRGLGIMRLFKIDAESTELQLEVIVQMIVQAGTAVVSQGRSDLDVAPADPA